MGQLYTLYNVDLRVLWYRGLHLSDWLLKSSHEDIVQLLRWRSPIVLPKMLDEYMQKGRKVAQRARLLKLPNELLDIIVDELTEDMGFLSLSATCKDLLTLAKRHLPKFYQLFQPQWSGCRIICLGEDTRELDDLPQRLLLPRERDELRSDVENAHSVYWTLADRYNKQGSVQSYMMTKWLERIDDNLRNGVYDETSEACYHGHRSDWRLFFSILSHRPYGYTPKPLPGGPEVLCNLKKREYVRKDGLSLPSCVTLAHALFVQTIWSPSASVGIRCDDAVRDRIKRGPWAGDSFCITTVETLPDIECVEEYSEDDKGEKEEADEANAKDGDEDVDGEGTRAATRRREWTDVTAEVDAVLVHLFEHDKESLEGLIRRGGMPTLALMRDPGEMI
ncbi:hypothetical protein GY45DRAFT_1337361 [Cubamyces sp. BRFM 1775]|nr:hypothetical protein GY45DRAFT_1337361 [Cubamyces sp. BRFM 1775]